MSARAAFARAIKAGKVILRDIFKAHNAGSKVKVKPVPQPRNRDVQLAESCRIAETVPSHNTLFSRIVPRVYYQSLARQLRRQAVQRLGQGSSSIFAFVGLALANSSNREEDIFTDQIREVGKISNEYKKSSILQQLSSLSLESFQIGGMIGQGCNAAVYEAKLKVHDIPTCNSTHFLPDETDCCSYITSSNQSQSVTDSVVSNNQSQSVTDSMVSNNQSQSVTDSMVIINKQSDFDIEDDIILLDQSDDIEESAPGVWSEEAVLGITDLITSVNFGLGITDICTDDLDLDISLDPDDIIILSEIESTGSGGDLEQDTTPPEYNLAVKIMFNYGAESNADTILREMEKEMVPSKMAESQIQMREWENGHKVKKKRLAPHPNIVDMWGVFVDPFPQLPEGLEQYPAALPQRLNPDGIGRNMTLFLVMQKYDMNLSQYLQTSESDINTRLLLLAQLLEGVVHMGTHGVSHRDMKSDNILLNCTTGEVPQLVIGDFGCCLADSEYGLKLPYQTEEVDRGGNTALMAPEISTAVPGRQKVLDYSKSDLWSVGALAYEIFGQANPFYSGPGHDRLDSRTYRESELPSLPVDVPGSVRNLVSSLLKRDPSKRPTPSLAADVISLYLWAPSHWWLPGNKVTIQEVKWWLSALAAEVFILRFSDCEFTPEFNLKASFLSRLNIENITPALNMIKIMD